jgi:hypothetical protein
VAGVVEQVEGFFAEVAGEGEAEVGVGVFDGDSDVVRQVGEVVHEELVGDGGAAVGAAGEGDEGFAFAALVVWFVARDFGQEGAEAVQVAAQNFAEDGVGIGEVPAQRGVGDAQRVGDEAHRGGDGAETGDQLFGEVQDIVLALALARGEVDGSEKVVGHFAGEAVIIVHGLTLSQVTGCGQ